MPTVNIPFKLNPVLQTLQTGILNVFTANEPQINSNKIIPMYSISVLKNEGLLNDPVLAGFSQQVTTALNDAKALMAKFGITDVSKAPAFTVNAANLSVVPGNLTLPRRIIFNPVGPLNPVLKPVAANRAVIMAPRPISGPIKEPILQPVHPLPPNPPAPPPPNPTFTPVSWLVNEAVIIASSLDLTNTNLIVQPSVAKLTIIVETLTCGPGAQISYNDSGVWNPSPLPQTSAPDGNSYNQSNHPDGSNDGPSGGDGTGGQNGAVQTVVPPAAPSISIYALNVVGMPAINLQGLKGAPGNPGQNGGNGGNGAKGINGSDIAAFGVGWCRQTPGNGGNGGNGGAGGNGSNGGQGGNGGTFLVATTQPNWQALLNQSWRIANTGGPGGDPGLPGRSGNGGAGGYPGDPSPGGACDKANGGSNGRGGTGGGPGGDGPSGTDGLITPTIITVDDWNNELTLPWLQSINPTEGPPGTAVTASGLNISTADVVLVNGNAVASTSPAAQELKFSLPSNLVGGTTTITVKRASDGTLSNAMNFDVTPYIAGSSESGGFTPGDLITLEGAAFLANASVHFTPTSQATQIIVPQLIAPDGSSLQFLAPQAGSNGPQSQSTASVFVLNPDGNSSNTFQLTQLSFLWNGFLPDPNGFAFKNFSPGTPDWSTFSDDFGSFEVGASAFAMPVLTAAYFGAYSYFLGDAATGLCTGFSTAAMNRFLNGETRTVDEAAQTTPALTRELTVNMGRLLSGQLLSTFLEQCANGVAQAQKTLQQIEQTFTNGANRDNMPVVFFVPAGLPTSSQWFDNLNASHCLVPFKLVRPQGWTGGYDGVELYLYDCNNPKDNNCFLTFSLKGTTLGFTYNKDNTVSTDNGWTLGVLTMDQALYDGVDLPWVYGAEAALEFVVDVILSPATLAVSNLAGQTTGVNGNSIVAEVPGAIPSLVRSHNIVMVPRQLALQRTIKGTGAGTYSYATIAPADPSPAAGAFNALLPSSDPSAVIVPGARGLTLQNVSCTATTSDVILLGPNNYSIQINTNDTGKTFNALLSQRYDVQTGTAPNVQTTQQMQLVSLSGINMAANETLLLWSDHVLGQVGVSNTGAAKAFTVTISTVNPASGAVTATQTVSGSVAANADFAVSVANWNQLAAPTMAQGALRGLLPSNFQMPTVQ